MQLGDSNLQRRQHRMRDYALYVVISLIVVVASIAFFYIWPGSFKEFGAMVSTIGIFGFFVSETRKLWQRWRFWGLFLVLIAAHSLVLYVFVFRVSDVPGFTWTAICVGEGLALQRLGSVLPNIRFLKFPN